MEASSLQIQQIVSDYLWLILPLIGAAIGWFTNYLAVKMLFRPRNAINLGFYKMQGVFPKRQVVLANKIANLVSDELLSPEELRKSIESASSNIDLKKILVQEIDNILLNKIPQAIPMASMFLNNEIADTIKNLIAGELESKLSTVLAGIGAEFANQIDVKDLVQDKINNFSSVKLEQLILEVMKKELKFIEFFGAILGFLIGLVQLLLVNLGNI